MTSIEPSVDETIAEKLSKIRCCTGCGKYINYLILKYGLYCSSCLSEIKEINPNEIITLEVLSKLIADIADQYAKNNQGLTGHSNTIKLQTQNNKMEIKKLKENLAYDMRSFKSNVKSTLQKSQQKCLQQHCNNALQAFFQPDLTATIINESQLIVQNMANLSVSFDDEYNQKGKPQAVYKFVEKHKKPQQVKMVVLKQYEDLRANIQSAHMQTRGIMTNFRSSIKQ